MLQQAIGRTGVWPSHWRPACAQGGAKVQEATVIFAELGDKFGWSVRLYNGAAACAMRAGEWEDAERLLNDAYAKDPKSADALANLAAVGLHLGKATVSRTLGRDPAPALCHCSAMAVGARRCGEV